MTLESVDKSGPAEQKGNFAVAASDHRVAGEQTESTIELQLLGGFNLCCKGEPVEPAPASQRILALLAINSGWLSRSYVAGTLWIESSERRATGSLRSALWRLRQDLPNLVCSSSGRIALAPDATVDVHELIDVSRCLDAGEDVEPLDEKLFASDLLPDWYDDWVIFERERLRQIRLQALEAWAERLIEMGDYSGAVRSALAAVQCESLRESSHRVLIRAHIKRGNFSEALRQYYLYTSLLKKELGLAPSPIMTELVGPLLIQSDVQTLELSAPFEDPKTRPLQVMLPQAGGL